MFGLFNSVADLVGDVAKVVIAPIEIAVDLAGTAVKPLADVAKDLAAEVKSMKD